MKIEFKKNPSTTLINVKAGVVFQFEDDPENKIYLCGYVSHIIPSEGFSDGYTDIETGEFFCDDGNSYDRPVIIFNDCKVIIER